MMSNVEIIDLIDDSQPDEVILLDDDEENEMQELFKENEQLSVLYQTCLNRSQSKGMIRIFKKIIIPAYKEIDENYSKSEKFNKVINNTLQLLKNDPKHTYSHIKSFYEILKLHKFRKKVDFVTLATNLKGNETKEGGKRKPVSVHNGNKKIKKDVINLDNDEPPVVILDEPDDLDEDLIYIEPNKTDSKIDNPQTKSMLSNSNNLATSNNNGINSNILPIHEENTLLIPHSEVCYNSEAEINKLERLMAKFRKKIVELEEREVVNDRGTSPYILCDKYKTALVDIYKKWCELMGTESVRSKKITLKVQEGHPPGPVRKLEEFLNNNIGSDGCPLFPDFNDVVECVLASNKEDGLSWSKVRVMSEATALFTQCGHALQKRRQKQEWYHLMSLVKQEQSLKDPAENSPELERRLQENKRQAKLKEDKILEKFSLLQDLPPKDKNRHSSETLKQDSEKSADVVKNVEVVVKQEPIDIVKQLEELGDNYTAVVQDIEDPFLVVEISDSSDEE